MDSPRPSGELRRWGRLPWVAEAVTIALGLGNWVGGGVGSLSETFADLESERVVDSNLRQTVRYTWEKP